MSAHTLEPWTIRYGEIIGSDNEILGVVYRTEAWTSGERVTTEDQANARLIAAAPYLLAALVSITDQLERVGDTREHKDGQFITAARAAIAKAEGREP